MDGTGDRFLPNLDVETVRGMIGTAEIVAGSPNKLRIPVEQLVHTLSITIIDLKALIEACLTGNQAAIKAAQRIVEP